ncbi:hypothetical protein ACSHWO_36460 (plasmid) [Streptomyces sp. HUAS TT3]|uniref:hypothetical protein n=1 Tax=Streptomyces sp. HUAS TT3 TaxID=3447510 RepID=UPI003F65F5BE
MTTTHSPRPAATSPASEVHDYPFTLRSDGPVLALFTGSRADQAVAARAADHAARTGHPVTVAAVVRSTGFSIKALLHLARGRRIRTEADAILAVLPVIARAGPVRTAILVVPARTNPYRTLPADLVERLAGRTGAAVALSPVPLTGYTSPITRELNRITDPRSRSHAMAADP